MNKAPQKGETPGGDTAAQARRRGVIPPAVYSEMQAYGYSRTQAEQVVAQRRSRAGKSAAKSKRRPPPSRVGL